jgi:hypothetical protein
MNKHKGECSGNTIFLCMKMEKWDMLKQFQEWGEEVKGEWLRGWIQLWFIVRTFLNVTLNTKMYGNKK